MCACSIIVPCSQCPAIEPTANNTQGPPVPPLATGEQQLLIVCGKSTGSLSTFRLTLSSPGQQLTCKLAAAAHQPRAHGLRSLTGVALCKVPPAEALLLLETGDQPQQQPPSDPRMSSQLLGSQPSGPDAGPLSDPQQSSEHHQRPPGGLEGPLAAPDAYAATVFSSGDDGKTKCWRLCGASLLAVSMPAAWNMRVHKDDHLRLPLGVAVSANGLTAALISGNGLELAPTKQ